MKNVIKNSLTGKDNTTWDLGRILWAIAFVTGLVLVISAHIRQVMFDVQGYGLGIGALLTGGGLGLKLKEDTEPESHTPQNLPPNFPN